MAASGSAPSTPQFHFISACLANQPEHTTLKLFLKQHQQPDIGEEMNVGDEQMNIGAGQPHGSRPPASGGAVARARPPSRPPRSPAPTNERPHHGGAPPPPPGRWGPGHRWRRPGHYRRDVWYPALFPLFFPPPVVEPVPEPVPVPVPVPVLPPGMPPEAVYYDAAVGLPPGWILLENGWRVPYGAVYPKNLRVIRRAPRAFLGDEQPARPTDDAKPKPPALASEAVGAESTPAYMENLLKMKKLAEDMRLIRQAGAAPAKSP